MSLPYLYFLNPSISSYTFFSWLNKRVAYFKNVGLRGFSQFTVLNVTPLRTSRLIAVTWENAVFHTYPEAINPLKMTFCRIFPAPANSYHSRLSSIVNIPLWLLWTDTITVSSVFPEHVVQIIIPHINMPVL